MKLKEKIQLSEVMVDYYLLGEDWVYNTLMGIQTAQGVGQDISRLTNWIKKKREVRKQKELLRKKQEQQKAKMSAAGKEYQPPKNMSGMV